MNSFTTIQKGIETETLSFPTISVVVILYNMDREGKRTLFSLSTNYQKGVSDQDYEVIVVDNGSKPPFPKEYLKDLKGNFRYYYIENASPSPAVAINYGVLQSRGKFVGIMIDGARILTPGIIHYALRAFAAFENPVVSILAWHLGWDIQANAILKGYNKKAEDSLLAKINWPEQGYRLFEISSLAGSNIDGWFMPKAESSCIFLSRENLDRLGGYDERFDKPGGGLLNLDMYRRACSLPDTDLVILLGEGSFHQLHGGAMTGKTGKEREQLFKEWSEQYRNIRGEPFKPPDRIPHYIGHAPPQAIKFLLFSAEKFLKTKDNFL